MTPMNRPAPQAKGGMSQAWEAFATITAIVATFVLAPILHRICEVAVRSWAISQYGSEWADPATLLCGVGSTVVVYWATYMLVLEKFIKRFMR